MRRLLLVVVSLAVLGALPLAARQATVTIRHDPAKKQYLVEIGGKPFTAYCYGPEFDDKPVFYPVMSPNAARVNREFPMVQGIAGESTDHPHHQSLFFAYDEVNGTNFWNPEKTGRRIEHRTAAAHDDRIEAASVWKDKDGHAVLDETDVVTFGGASDVFWMDHVISLRADVPVTMGDTKEGAFGIRLNDTLKEAGGSGRYINAEGLETSAKVWGKTSPWVAIRGTVKDQRGDTPVTVAIFAHPKGLNYPPYWHARDYGLFAVNPFARHGYDPQAPERITKIAAGQTLGLVFRLAVYATQVPKERLDRDFATFTALRARAITAAE
jgi:methane monooxygenase PmoA-like